MTLCLWILEPAGHGGPKRQEFTLGEVAESTVAQADLKGKSAKQKAAGLTKAFFVLGVPDMVHPSEALVLKAPV